MEKKYIYYGIIIHKEEVTDKVFYNEMLNINNGYRNINIKGIAYTIYNMTVDFDDNCCIFHVRRSYKFLHDIYYKNYDVEIIEELKSLGYSKSNVAGVGKHLYTNANKALYYFTDNNFDNGGIGYVCDNIMTAKSIAAIQNENDVNQLFKFPNDEPEYCESFSCVDEWGDFEDTDYPKKMTPEEIIEYYKNFKFPEF